MKQDELSKTFQVLYLNIHKNSSYNGEVKDNNACFNQIKITCFRRHAHILHPHIFVLVILCTQSWTPNFRIQLICASLITSFYN